MTDAKSSIVVLDQVSATSPARSQTLSSEGVLDALKMILTDAPLNDVLHSVALLIEAHSEGLLCTIYLLDEVGSCGAAAYLRKPVYVADVLTHPHFANFRGLLVQAGLRAVWSSPIISNDGKVLGTFGMYNREVRLPSPAEMQLIDYAGRIAGIAIERDRSKSALTLAFQKIKKSETELREIVDVIPQTIIVLNPDGKAIYANRVALEYNGLSLDDVRADDFRARILHPDDVQRLREERHKALSGAVPFENAQRALGKDGKYRWFLRGTAQSIGAGFEGGSH